MYSLYCIYYYYFFNYTELGIAFPHLKDGNLEKVVKDYDLSEDDEVGADFKMACFIPFDGQ